MIVMKFGGTSVESAAAIERVASIIRTRLTRNPVVVVSAMGKTTNKLLAIAAQAVQGNRDEALALLDELHRFHLTEGRSVVSERRRADLEAIVDGLFQELESWSKASLLWASLRHEPLTPSPATANASRVRSSRSLSRISVSPPRTSTLVTSSLPIRVIPRPLHFLPQTYSRLAATIPPLAREKVVVMGGFIGATEEGVTSTLGRGGFGFHCGDCGRRNRGRRNPDLDRC